MFFANEQREKVREDNPGIKFGKFEPCLCRALLVADHAQVRSARFLVRSGRHSTRSNALRTTPRLPPIRSVTRRRRLLTR